jgi:methanogenic corrinoid protein MtbC1
MGHALKGRDTMALERTEEALTPEMEELATLVAELKESEVLAAIEKHLANGVGPDEILAACQKGMRLVGSMHEEGMYFIAGLIMAGEIMRQAVDLLKPVMIKTTSSEKLGRVLLGTIAGDIHDIGKNLFRDLLECHGFTVLDLGVDVPPAEFVRAEAEFKPHLVAVSALVTDSFPQLSELVNLFGDTSREGGKRPVIIIGGGAVDDVVHRASGSDYWAQDAFMGVKLCQRLVAAKKQEKESSATAQDAATAADR